MDTQEKEDKILSTPEVHRIEIARKLVDDEIIFRYVIIFGNVDLGYIASYEEWFQPIREDKPEFYEVLFQTSIYPTVAEALIDALPSAVKESGNIGDWQEKEKADNDIDPLNPSDYEISDGFVGSMGKTYTTATEETLWDAIEKAAERGNRSTDSVVDALLNGFSVAWCDSPNYYYDHAVGHIRRKKQNVTVALVKCDCGHSVPSAQVMSASRGTSCFDCYEKMSN